MKPRSHILQPSFLEGGGGRKEGGLQHSPRLHNQRETDRTGTDRPYFQHIENVTRLSRDTRFQLKTGLAFFFFKYKILPQTFATRQNVSTRLRFRSASVATRLDRHN